MIEEAKSQTYDDAPTAAPMTIATRLSEAESQIQSHHEAFARLGSRLEVAEKAIQALLREVGAA